MSARRALSAAGLLLLCGLLASGCAVVPPCALEEDERWQDLMREGHLASRGAVFLTAPRLERPAELVLEEAAPVCLEEDNAYWPEALSGASHLRIRQTSRKQQSKLQGLSASNGAGRRVQRRQPAKCRCNSQLGHPGGSQFPATYVAKRDNATTEARASGSKISTGQAFGRPAWPCPGPGRETRRTRACPRRPPGS